MTTPPAPTTVLTYDEVSADLEAIVAEWGADHIYEGPDPNDSDCLYVHTASDGALIPGCLIGVWLARRGIALERMARMENDSADAYVPRLLDVENRALYLLTQAQHRQDNRVAWGDALALGRDAVDTVDWDNNPWIPNEN